jgi:aryl-alcohol dehydrogenase-like predicted oxidoreductase
VLPPYSDGMERRVLGRTGRAVGVIGLGAWQLGADWGEVSAEAAHEVLQSAVDAGSTFIDTADVYGDGRSERLIGAFLRDHPGAGLTVATKMGRRALQDPAEFTLDAFRGWTDRSRVNLGVDTLDLVQLHCPPTAILSRDQLYDDLDQLVAEDRIAAYGVSVETCAEALTAIARPRVATIQIILNPLRRKPLDQVLPAALAAGVGIIVRVPLASGLLSGRYTSTTTFAPDDHRTYNRDGSSFDVGETFAGVPFETGVGVAAQMAKALGPQVPLAAASLRWSLDRAGVSVVIPGARDAAQAHANALAADLPPLAADVEAAWQRLYDQDVRPLVHNRW